MDTFRHYIRLYFLIQAQYLKTRLQFRADFAISSVGMVFMSVSTLTVFWVLFHSVTNLGGWRFDEILFVYGFYTLATVPLQIFFENIWQLRFHVLNGTFIKYYLRPVNMMFYYMSEVTDPKGIPQLVLGVAALVYASSRLGITWTLGKLLLFGVSLTSSALVLVSMATLAACSAFWFAESYPMLAFVYKLREFAQYPPNILDGFARALFTYVLPVGFIAFYPAQMFLRGWDMSLVTYASPLLGFALFALTCFVWRRGVNRYAGAGS